MPHLHHLFEVQALRAYDKREATDKLGDEAVLDQIRRLGLQKTVRLLQQPTRREAIVALGVQGVCAGEAVIYLYILVKYMPLHDAFTCELR